jgi:hypothetical protein
MRAHGMRPAVLATNRQPAQQNASGPSCGCTLKAKETAHFQGLSQRPATRLEPGTFCVSVSTYVARSGNQELADVQELPSG